MTRTIEYLHLSTLTADPANPRTHALDTITDSITRFGYLEPIVRDERTGFIVSGHGRTEALLASQAAGEQPPEGVQADGADWLVPVVTGWASRDDAEARGALIALNRTGQLGGWDDTALLDLLNQLSTTDPGFTGIGFDVNDLDDLTARLEEAGAADPRDYQNTRETPSMTDYAEKYDEQGRRLIVLDYDKEQYNEVTTRLRLMRDETGTESNADAVLKHLLAVYPEVPETALTEANGA